MSFGKKSLMIQVHGTANHFGPNFLSRQDGKLFVFSVKVKLPSAPARPGSPMKQMPGTDSLFFPLARRGSKCKGDRHWISPQIWGWKTQLWLVAKKVHLFVFLFKSCFDGHCSQEARLVEETPLSVDGDLEKFWTFCTFLVERLNREEIRSAPSQQIFHFSFVCFMELRGTIRGNEHLDWPSCFHPWLHWGPIWLIRQRKVVLIDPSSLFKVLVDIPTTQRNVETIWLFFNHFRGTIHTKM